jgi:uncharacterized repeat protein (TIGR03803 family)
VSLFDGIGPNCTRLLGAGLAIGMCAGSAAAATLTVVHDFTGGADGSTPYKAPTVDTAGNIYGETMWGANVCPDSYEYAGIGCGTVYEIAPSLATTALVTYKGSTNGAAGFANVTVAGGYVVDAAYQGGPANLGEISAVKTGGGGFVILHKFAGTDGANPNTFVRVGPDNILYSVANTGGPGYNGTAGSGSGVLFSLTTTGVYTPQHYFGGGADGGAPGRIFLNSSGTIFGATSVGGSCSGTGLPANGCGVVYQFVPSTGVFTVLYTFTGGADGYSPGLGGLAANGTLYGSTGYGGADGEGTLFQLTKTKNGYTYKTLWTFTGGSDGAEPLGAPSLSSNGTLVGTTFYGPITQTSSGAGTLYTFANGTLTTLFTFTNDANGGYPEGTPVMTSNGTIYGTAAFGGSNIPCNTAGGTLISSYGCGVVYKYVP